MADRSELQREANDIDLEIFRLISRLASFEHKTRNQDAKLVRETIQQLRKCRVAARMLMSKEDQERTSG